uniref:Plexin-A1 n=1 Tax=Sipha flava TaxID=143950 RepID=A0A2S2R0Y6_9HEMI
MDKSRRSKNNESNWNHFSRLLFVCAVMVCGAASCDCAATDNATIVCPAYMECTKCTKTPSCSWSLSRQTCVDPAQKADGLMVYNDENCPRYAVHKPTVYSATVTMDYAYTVNVSNDVYGFLAFLNRTNVTCYEPETGAATAAVVTKDAIVCGSTKHSNTRAMAFRFYYMAFGDRSVLLRFDNRTDNYVTFYWDTLGCRDVAEYCATCLWDGPDGHVNRYDRCSSNNPCTHEMFEYLSVRSSRDYSSVLTGPVPVRVLGCHAMGVESVTPATGSWNGGTTVRIVVRNHNVLAEHRTVTVTVDGRNCAYPKTVDNETITCVTSPTAMASPMDGVVEVSYDTVRLATAPGTFRFVYPEVTTSSPACGPLRGGTQLRIEGMSLDISRAVRVFVGRQNMSCETIARGPRHIFCMTSPMPGGRSSTGPVSVLFDKVLSLRAVNAFTYTDDEPAIDKGQQFKGIASGGTTVPVRGTRFACVESAELHVVVQTSSRHISSSCAVRNDTYMVCRSPKLDVLSASETSTVLANLFFRLEFAGRVIDLSPQSDSPGYLLYADPEFIDFETVQNRVVIGGRGLDLGYEIADVAIRFQNASGACNVTKHTQHQIACDPSTLVPRTGDHVHSGDGVVVTIGDSFEYIVKKKSTRYNVYPVKIFSIFSGIKIFLIITTVLGSILFCVKTSMGNEDDVTDIINVQYCLSEDIRKSTAT